VLISAQGVLISVRGVLINVRGVLKWQTAVTDEPLFPALAGRPKAACDYIIYEQPLHSSKIYQNGLEIYTTVVAVVVTLGISAHDMSQEHCTAHDM
jgi:hypothetical protein